MYLFLSLKTSPSLSKYNFLINIYSSPFPRLFITEAFIYHLAELYLAFWIIKGTRISFETSKKPNWKEPNSSHDRVLHSNFSLFSFKKPKIKSQLLNNNLCSLKNRKTHKNRNKNNKQKSP